MLNNNDFTVNYIFSHNPNYLLVLIFFAFGGKNFSKFKSINNYFNTSMKQEKLSEIDIILILKGLMENPEFIKRF